MFESVHEECGVYGIYEPERSDVASSVYFGLFSLQHRGQESCGIAVCDDGVISCKKGEGLVSEVFDKEKLSSVGKGNIAVGHVRYSTAGGNSINNVQPLVIRHIKGNMALVHNGNLVNATQIRNKFELEGAIFHGSSDTEAIAYSIVHERVKCSSTEEAVKRAMPYIEGAYSCILMSATKLIAFRDKNGFRPLVLGQCGNGAVVVASESCALDATGAVFIRDIDPGEIVVIDKSGIHSIKPELESKKTVCIFEYIYFARPDSVIEGVSVHHARIKAGEILAKNDDIQADVVIGVPDSGLDAAIGYSKQSGIPYGIGFIKNKYVGRSFIAPEQEQREKAVKIKLNVIKETIAGKKVVMIDDSIVRGTTSARIVKMLREAGAKEVHLRISSPPFKHPCYFGTDIDSSENLIADKFDSVEKIAEFIGVDTLKYLPIETLGELTDNKTDYCDGCFSGKYPIDTSKAGQKNKFDEKIKYS